MNSKMEIKNYVCHSHELAFRQAGVGISYLFSRSFRLLKNDHEKMKIQNEKL